MLKKRGIVRTARIGQGGTGARAGGGGGSQGKKRQHMQGTTVAVALVAGGRLSGKRAGLCQVNHKQITSSTGDHGMYRHELYKSLLCCRGSDATWPAPPAAAHGGALAAQGRRPRAQVGAPHHPELPGAPLKGPSRSDATHPP